jgi:hypothetical protein
LGQEATFPERISCVSEPLKAGDCISGHGRPGANRDALLVEWLIVSCSKRRPKVKAVAAEHPLGGLDQAVGLRADVGDNPSDKPPHLGDGSRQVRLTLRLMWPEDTLRQKPCEAPASRGACDGRPTEGHSGPTRGTRCIGTTSPSASSLSVGTQAPSLSQRGRSGSAGRSGSHYRSHEKRERSGYDPLAEQDGSARTTVACQHSRTGSTLRGAGDARLTRESPPLVRIKRRRTRRRASDRPAAAPLPEKTSRQRSTGDPDGRSRAAPLPTLLS